MRFRLLLAWVQTLTPGREDKLDQLSIQNLTGSFVFSLRFCFLAVVSLWFFFFISLCLLFLTLRFSIISPPLLASLRTQRADRDKLQQFYCSFLQVFSSLD